jgi:hypothetical protein
MPFFGHKDESQREADSSSARQDEVDRLEALTLAQLAADVMTKGFGPGGPGADHQGTTTVGGPNINAGPTVAAIALEFAPGGSTRGGDDALRQRRYRLIAEGLQAAEHASLIRAQMHTAMNSFDYTLTRHGRAALGGGAVDRAFASASG